MSLPFSTRVVFKVRGVWKIKALPANQQFLGRLFCFLVSAYFVHVMTEWRNELTAEAQ